MSPFTARLFTTGAPELGPVGERLMAAIEAPGFAPVALSVAVGAGALHALAPGHGKSLAAAYLVGAHGRRRDALLLGGTVAVMHSLSVLVIALVWTGMSQSGAFDLGPASWVLKVAAAVLVLVVGILLVRRRTGHPHRHGHSHDGADATDHAHAPDHAPAERPGLLLLGASGGLLPSPSAFLVMLTGFFGGRTGLALVLVAAFGLGMAVVLGGVGVATVSGRDLLARAAPANVALRRVARFGPAVAAWSVLVAGCLLTAAALAGTPVT